MKKYITSAILLMTAVFTLSAANYTLDDNSVDALFEHATEQTLSGMELINNIPAELSSASFANVDEITLIIACVIDYVGLGAFGIHRYVLGTKGSMWMIYTFTVCGIFGIVPFIDFWAMIIDGLILGNADKYIDNEEFFMWL